MTTTAEVVQIFAGDIAHDDVEQDDAEIDHLPSEGLSFFTAAEAIDASVVEKEIWERFERADEVVCSRVWSHYLRDSVERGFARDRNPEAHQPLPPHIAASVTVAATPQCTEGSMAKGQIKRGERLETVLSAFRTYVTKHGTRPNSQQLFEQLGEPIAKSVENVRTALKRLEAKGLLDGGETRPIVDASAGASASARSSKTTAAAPKASRPPPVDPVVSALIAKRDELASKVAALTIAITALQEG